MTEGLRTRTELIPCFQEKPRSECRLTVPQTDTGRRGENPKALERTLVKELGKLHRNFGRRCALLGEETCSWSRRGLQRNGGSDCLLKTQDSAKSKDDV